MNASMSFLFLIVFCLFIIVSRCFSLLNILLLCYVSLRFFVFLCFMLEPLESLESLLLTSLFLVLGWYVFQKFHSFSYISEHFGACVFVHTHTHTYNQGKHFILFQGFHNSSEGEDHSSPLSSPSSVVEYFKDLIFVRAFLCTSGHVCIHTHTMKANIF